MRTRAYFPVPRNGVKTKTFSPQNNRTTELNINFLLTATVCSGPKYSTQYWSHNFRKIQLARLNLRKKLAKEEAEVTTV